MEKIKEKEPLAASRKMHPQKRVYSAVAEMIENRRPDRDQATDWMERGWNPFLKQEGTGWQQSRPAFEMMVESGRWEEWLCLHKTRLAELAGEAFERNPNGKLDARGPLELAAQRCWSKEGSALALLLDIGADPNSKSGKYRDKAPMNDASSTGARLLAESGWDPKGEANGAGSVWAHWAVRRIHGRLDASELDWLESLGSPVWEKPGGLEVGRLAMERPSEGSVDVLGRLARSKAPTWVYGSLEPGDLARVSSQLMKGGDASKMLEAMGAALGWPAVVESFSFDAGNGSAAGEAVFSGRVKSLGLLREHGLFGSGDAALVEQMESCASRWEKSAASKSNRVYWAGEEPAASGMSWALSRLSKASSEQASAVFGRCAKAFPEKAARLAKSCASKGFLKASGPESIAELYGSGKQWNEAEAGQSFEAFVALVESKLFKQAFKPKQQKSASRSKSL